MSDSPKSILVLITDHQRSDSLFQRQNGHEVTPFLNSLVNQGKASHFKRAYSTSPLCIPARNAMATGLYPTRGGMTINHFDAKRRPKVKLVTSMLADAGYEVAHIGKNDIYVDPWPAEQCEGSLWIDDADYQDHLKNQGLSSTPFKHSEMNSIFKQVTFEIGNRERWMVSQPYTKPISPTPWHNETRDFRDFYFAKKAVDFMRDAHQRKQPFVCFLSLPSPHPPFIIPQEFLDKFPSDNIEIPENVGQPATGEPANRRQCVAAQLCKDVPIETLRDCWAAHFSLVNLADQAMSEVYRALESSDMLEDTAMIFTSDHGHNLGQHQMYGINELYEQTIHIPMNICLPGSKPRIHDELVSHLDITPTLLDLAGLENDASMSGISLIPHLLSEKPLPQRRVFSQFSGQLIESASRRAVIDQQYKYIYDPEDIPELYDLEKDPLETQNLAHDVNHFEILRDMHHSCAEFHRSQNDDLKYLTR